MTPEEHQERHKELHRMSDELLACYLEEGFARQAHGGKRGSIHDEIFELIKWAYQKTLSPSPTTREEWTHDPLPSFVIAQNDDPELLEWLNNAQQRGGGFVKNLAEAGLNADCENYPMIRPLLIFMRLKYPEYEPTDQVKQEIRERKA